jgi:hypothetical protein
VQFTRNPDGIGGALRKIGSLTQQTGLGSRIEHPQAEALSHLFLGAARPSFVRGMFATHPPLDERVRRIYGRTMEMLPAKEDAVALALGGLAPSPEIEPRSPIEFVPTAASGAASAPSPTTAAPMPAAFSPVAGLVAASAAAASRLSAEVGTVRAFDGKGDSKGDRRYDLEHDPDFSLDDGQRAVVASLRAAARDATRAQMMVLALLVDKAIDLRTQQRALIAEAYGSEGARLAESCHEDVQRLPPGARQPLADVAMPTLRRLPPEARARLLRVAHLLISADGRLTIREFLLYSILKRRLGPDAGRAVPVRYASVRPLASEASQVLSLVALLRLPERPDHAFNAGALLLKEVDARRVDADALKLDSVSVALDRLNQLAPLAKPVLIKASTAVAFVDGQTNWKAASALRMICAALDAPLPPQVLAVEGA